MSFAPVEFFAAQRARVIAECERIGRDPQTMTWSAGLVVCCGETDQAFVRRANAIGREPDELRANGACGSPKEVADAIARFHAAGASRIYLQVLDLADHDHLRLIASDAVTEFLPLA